MKKEITKREPKKRTRKTKSLEDLGEILVQNSENPTPANKKSGIPSKERNRVHFIKGGLKIFR